jgi:hypothetical protein
MPDRDNLLGDLRDRYQEFWLLIRGIDPKQANPMLGYPLWSYVIAGAWAFPGSFIASKFVFLVVQILLFSAVAVSLKRCSQLGWPLAMLVLAASVPAHIAHDLASWGNYGLVLMACFWFSFVACKPLLRGVSLGIVIVKPQVGIVAWLAALLRVDWPPMLIGGLIFICESLIGAYFLKKEAISYFFSTLSGGFSGRLDHFYSTGNYGIVGNFVQSGLLPTNLVLPILLAVYLLVLAALFKLLVDPVHRYVVTVALFPIFCYHRTHDLMLFLPLLFVLIRDSLRHSGLRSYFYLLPLVWSCSFRETQPIPLLILVLMVAIWFCWIVPSPSPSPATEELAT